MNRSHACELLGGTEPSEGTVAIMAHIHDCSYVCLKPPTKKRRNHKLKVEDTVECSTDLYK